ncbi:transposase IS4 family protein [Desulfatibacillum aliphaticivorans]|uniref:Transposase IS4 family protein n=1 Tax=Desulfatibacillum aliphaticivorans TaxID=218208 RepID=B8F9S2_DESAL|nr:IS5-like element ISDal2 family transposase [Desulfatibacillum aliphaticivorans]ACL03018.1 transposase IS4 family protein [Desulfatibacillum aliphaticivorans]
MKPRQSPVKDQQQDLFKVELARIVDPNHPLVKLSKAVNWDRLDEVFGETYCPDNGRPGVSTRLMVSLHYLKYTEDQSDEQVLKKWAENPYWQVLSGMKYFEHELPIDPSSMTRWRKRVGEAGAEELLKETIQTGLELGAVKWFQLNRINVDTTVQEKEVRFPTDSRLYDRARERLVKAAKARGIVLRQSYKRLSKTEVTKQGRYAHARQMKRAARSTRKLKTYLGRVIRDIERKCPDPDRELQDLLSVARHIHARKQKDKNKVYSVHAPEVECISKGKAHKRYEFGCKVSVAATSKGGWFVGAMALHGNPYDGHTLKGALAQVERIARQPQHAFVDMGYRGHGYEGDVQVHVDKRRRGRTPKSLWRWMKRRAAVEPAIGHLKREHRMERNRLAGTEGDKFNAILSAAGMNFHKLQKFLEELLRLYFFRIMAAQYIPLLAVAKEK